MLKEGQYEIKRGEKTIGTENKRDLERRQIMREWEIETERLRN